MLHQISLFEKVGRFLQLLSNILFQNKKIILAFSHKRLSLSQTPTNKLSNAISAPLMPEKSGAI
jgi:hypothetical protein